MNYINLPYNHVEGIGRGFIAPKSCFLQQIVRICAFVAPPMDENGNGFGSPLRSPPTTCDSNLARIGHSVCDLWHFLWNRPLPLSLEADYGRTIRIIKMPSGHFYRIGPETTCTNFCEIWSKYVGIGSKSVFWIKLKMAEKLYWRKWAWPMWGDASWPKESCEKRILNLRPTVQEL